VSHIPLHSTDGVAHSTWATDGYLLLRNAFRPDEMESVLNQITSAIRRDPPTAHADAGSYVTAEDLHIVRESKVRRSDAPLPEELVSRVFNCHTHGACMEISSSPLVVDAVVRILGKGIDCFQSQCIFKNAGAIGQGWHQDSHYFPFDPQPQVGAWIALTDATLDNSCLWVLPGSHSQPIHEHVPDRRAGANAGYLEIVDQDFGNAIPMLMSQGDVLLFHSFLMHRSGDNSSQHRRAALVLHYARSGTRILTANPSLAELTRWISVG
jgi:ectoine hydroxylase-related dioxygenase (phytanoyl-CoA dioxygenase family)